MVKTLLLTTAACLALAGCASSKPSDRLIRSIQKIERKPELVKLPEINKTLTVEIGDSLISEQYRYADPALEVTEKLSIETSNIGRDFTLSIHPGKYIAKGQDEYGIFYESVTGKLTANDEHLNSIKFGVYATSSSPATIEIYTLTSDGRPLSYPAKNLSFKKFDIESTASTRFTKELVYTGVSKNIITILYREYSDGVARPAFTQELKYDIGEGNIFGFKGARFEIIRATNTGLTYKAISHLY